MIEASTPVRICDNGGWTDTWFGGPGRVLNIAVSPGVEVTIQTTAGPGSVVLDVEDFDDRYSVVPGESRPARHPLLEAAIDAFPPPRDLALEIGVRCAVPPGCGCGTSAAVAVAVLGALTALRSEPVSPRALAYAAHRLEVDLVGAQSGIQDQLSAAFGGINYLVIEPVPGGHRAQPGGVGRARLPVDAGLSWVGPMTPRMSIAGSSRTWDPARRRCSGGCARPPWRRARPWSPGISVPSGRR